MKQGKWLILLILILFSVPASAEFYRYLDEKGNVRYTDDFTMVPKDQRAGIQEYIESQSTGLKKEKSQDKVKVEEDVAVEENQESLPAENKEENQNTAGDLAQIKSNLDKTKQDLDNEYRGLGKEKEAFDKASKNAKTEKEIIKANENILKFNKKVAEYEKKRKAFNAEVEAYNAGVANENVKQK